MKKHIKRINLTLLVLYIAFLLYLTLFRNFLGRTEGIYEINLIPFKNIIGITNGWINGTITIKFYIRNIFGNILAFTPLAYFGITLLKIKKLKTTILISSIIIITIELSQYFLQIGVCDIDDAILNLTGITIAFLILNQSEVLKTLKTQRTK